MAGPITILELEPHDDVVSVRDQLALSKSSRVLLVWPREGRILTRKLDLVLLQREMRRHAGRLALVTVDPDVIDNAHDLNISAFPSVRASHRQRWKRGRHRVFITRQDKPDSELDHPDELRATVTRLRDAPTPRHRPLRRGLGLIVLTLVVLIMLSAAYVLLPSATITLTPLSEHLEVTIRIVADPAVTDVDLSRAVVPATVLRVEIEESASADTTGTLESEAVTARGSVIFTNQTNEPITVPAGTTVATSTGAIVRFRTLEAVNVAAEANAIAVAPVEALPDFAGMVGNVVAYAIDHIDGPLADVLTVQNIDPTHGGTVPTSRIVAAADHERLLAAVRQAIQQRALGELEPLVGEGQELIAETLQIAEERPEWTQLSANIGDEADAVSLTMRAIVQAVVVNQRLVNQAAFAGLTARIPAGQVVAPDSMTFRREGIELITDAGQVTFLATVESDVTHAVDVEALQGALTGMSYNETLLYLFDHVELAPASEPVITIWPAFTGRMPLLPARITIRIRPAA